MKLWKSNNVCIRFQETLYLNNDVWFSVPVTGLLSKSGPQTFPHPRDFLVTSPCLPIPSAVGAKWKTPQWLWEGNVWVISSPQSFIQCYFQKVLERCIKHKTGWDHLLILSQIVKFKTKAYIRCLTSSVSPIWKIPQINTQQVTARAVHKVHYFVRHMIV